MGVAPPAVVGPPSGRLGGRSQGFRPRWRQRGRRIPETAERKENAIVVLDHLLLGVQLPGWFNFKGDFFGASEHDSPYQSKVQSFSITKPVFSSV